MFAIEIRCAAGNQQLNLFTPGLYAILESVDNGKYVLL